MTIKSYHFCLMRQSRTPGNLEYVDGTLSSDMDFTFSKNYHDLRCALGAKLNPPAQNGEGVVILSLTVIKET